LITLNNRIQKWNLWLNVIKEIKPSLSRYDILFSVRLTTPKIPTPEPMAVRVGIISNFPAYKKKCKQKLKCACAVISLSMIHKKIMLTLP